MPLSPAMSAGTMGAPTRGIVLARAGSPPQERLELGHRVRQKRRVPASLDRESHRAVQCRHLVRTEAPSLPFPEPDSGDALSAGDLVVDRYGVTPDLHHPRQGVEPGPSLGVYQLLRLDEDAGALELVPTRHRLELGPDPGQQRLGRQLAQRSARAAPELVQLGQRPAQPSAVWMHRLAGDERLREEIPGGGPKRLRDRVAERFHLALEVEPEVGEAALGR